MTDTVPRPKILVVEDEPTSKLVLEMVFTQDGRLDFTITDDGNEALNLIETTREGFSALLTDLELGPQSPPVSGFDLAKRAIEVGIPQVTVNTTSRRKEREELLAKLRQISLHLSACVEVREKMSPHELRAYIEQLLLNCGVMRKSNSPS